MDSYIFYFIQRPTNYVINPVKKLIQLVVQFHRTEEIERDRDKYRKKGKHRAIRKNNRVHMRARGRYVWNELVNKELVDSSHRLMAYKKWKNGKSHLCHVNFPSDR